MTELRHGILSRQSKQGEDCYRKRKTLTGKITEIQISDSVEQLFVMFFTNYITN